MPRRVHSPAAFGTVRAARAPWSSCDARARLLATAAGSLLLLAPGGWTPLLGGCLAVMLLLSLSGTGPLAALSSLRPFRFLLFFTLVVQLFFTPGEPLLPGVLPAAVTGAGVTAAVQALFRIGGVIVVSAHLVATTSPLELARSLGWIIAPTAALGVRVREVTLVMALGFQFFPVLIEESRQVRSALESRGISLRHPRARMRARALLVWTLAVLFGMVDRSARLATALEAKGFGASGKIRHRFPPWNRESTLLTAGGAALVALALVLAFR